MNNQTRVSRARTAVQRSDNGTHSIEENILDMLTDIEHLANAEKLNFNQLIQIAHQHFVFEDMAEAQ